MSEEIQNGTNVKVFLDDNVNPFTEVQAPTKILLDTTKLTDGPHQLKLVAKSSANREGIKIINFEVRNGPDISVIGLENNQIVNKKIPLTINAYGSQDEKFFLITGSENPKGIPIWVWVSLILFIGWGMHYLFLFWTSTGYKSFF